MPDIKTQIAKKTEEVEKTIYAYLPEETGYQKTVLQAMNYSMKAGGKRLRPMMMEQTYLMFGGNERDVIEPFMAAIEMIHTYSLIHDDLPALDNDDYRRGRKTNHVVFGEDMAILAGDGLLNFAFETASKAFHGDERDIRIARAFRILTSKPGIYGMIGGQVVDVESSGENEKITMDKLLYIHENKTAALIECAMMVGAILGGATAEETRIIEKIAKNIGLAFQIQDDILDITSTTEELGKPVGSDEKNEKQTYITLKGMEQSVKDVEEYTKEAVDLFDKLPYKNEFLRNLLLSLVNRTH